MKSSITVSLAAAAAFLWGTSALAEPLVGGFAAGTGLVAGTAMAYAMRALKKGEAHGNVSSRDYQGAEGEVLVAIAPGGTGKVRTRLRGEEIDLLATSDEPEALPKGTPIIVIEVVGPQARVMRRKTVLGD